MRDWRSSNPINITVNRRQTFPNDYLKPEKWGNIHGAGQSHHHR
jgi:hypothetical protein